jgi:CDP-6-deoxy-D-xylo-4-hexulose-3-dehydrase
MAGFKVQLVDVDPATLNVSIDDLPRHAPTAGAISLVHLMGNPAPMQPVLDLCASHNLALIEDCCESLGATWNGTHVGNFGRGGAFSFFFSHHMTTMEGGMVTLPDRESADRVRVLRAHGWLRNVSGPAPELAGLDIDPRYAFVNWGFNVRPTELQAGFGLRQLEKLPAFNARRAELSARVFAWVDRSGWLTRPRVEAAAEPCWMALPLMVTPGAPFSRRDITAHLEAAGVETRPIVTGNVARQPAASLFPSLGAGPLPGADAVHARGFYIGLSPLSPDSAVDRLIETLEDFVRGR